MSIKNLFYSSYWFKQPVIATREVYYIMFVGLIIMTFAGFVAKYFSTKTSDTVKRKLLQSSGDLFSSMGMTGLVLFFFRQQSVPLLGLRIWFLLWALVFVAWLGKIVKYSIKRAPQIKSEQAEKALLKKYLPTGK